MATKVPLDRWSRVVARADTQRRRSSGFGQARSMSRRRSCRVRPGSARPAQRGWPPTERPCCRSGPFSAVLQRRGSPSASAGVGRSAQLVAGDDRHDEPREEIVLHCKTRAQPFARLRGWRARLRTGRQYCRLAAGAGPRRRPHGRAPDGPRPESQRADERGQPKPMGDHACRRRCRSGDSVVREIARRKSLLLAALAGLTDRERGIIVDRRLKESRASLKDLSERYGVSIELIRQIETRALDRLRQSIEVVLH
jgi:DNA-directed RNA polymerase specialized sigma24 family protein